MVFSIDYDRGVHMRTHPAGIDVYMYVDTPGVYLSPHGTVIAERFATEAGFPTEVLGKQKLLRERMATAMDKVKAELEMAEKKHVVKREKEGFKLIDLGMGRYMVQDPECNDLLPAPVTDEQAGLLLESLVPDKPKAPPVAVKK